MDFWKYILDKALILIPMLWIVGEIVKKIEVIPNKWIPLILLPIGIGFALALSGPSVDSAIQGILVTGAAVYGDQLKKQLGKAE